MHIRIMRSLIQHSIMHLHKLTTAFAVLAASVGIGAFATGARAAIIDNEGVHVSTTQKTFSEGADGTVAWDWTNGTIKPHLTGTLTYQGANACYRVSTTAYDQNLNVIYTKHGNGWCPTGTGSQNQPIDLPGNSSPRIDSLYVSVEEKGSNHDWQPYATSNPIRPTLHSDLNVNVSDGPYTVDGEVDYTLDKSSGKMSAYWRGSLTLAGAPKQPAARILLRLLDDTGTQVDRLPGTSVTPDDAGNYYDHEDLSFAPTSSGTQVEIALQTQNSAGLWHDLKSTTVSVAE